MEGWTHIVVERVSLKNLPTRMKTEYYGDEVHEVMVVPPQKALTIFGKAEICQVGENEQIWDGDVSLLPELPQEK